jgi:hypothetical protein
MRFLALLVFTALKGIASPAAATVEKIGDHLVGAGNCKQ